MIILCIVLVIICSVLLYITINLNKKVIKYESVYITQAQILASYNSYLNKISDIIEVSEKKLHAVDSRGSFKSDDEVGFFFEQIKNIQENLNAFKISNRDEYNKK